jgi:hypothetical protein
VSYIIKLHAKRFKNKASEDLWIRSWCHILKLSHEYWGNETVTHRCHAASLRHRCWRLEKADEDFCMMDTSRILFSVIEDFIIIAV